MTITLTNMVPLPAITDPVTINGYTQAGSTPNTNAGFAALDTNLNVTIDADLHPAFLVTAGDTTIRGLVIQDAFSNAITLQTNGGNVIAGNFIGTDRQGMMAVPNSGAGVVIESGDDNDIGGVAAADRNLISGNLGTFVPDSPGYGVHVKGGSDHVIAGNLIGTDAAGAAAVGNQVSGVRLSGFTTSTSNTTVGGTAPGAGNVLSANGGSAQGYGVYVGGSGIGNKIQGNRIGTDVTGTAQLGNNPDGIELITDETVQVGGTAAGAGNLISGNVSMGIHLNSPDHVIEGNTIGTNAAGTGPVANGQHGIYANGNTGTRIGGPGAAARNVISGNGGSGIDLAEAASGYTVQGNFVGTDAVGAASVPNGGAGVAIEGGTGNLIGGGPIDQSGGEGNLVSGNGGAGVTIFPAEDPEATDNDVTGNLIGTDLTGTQDLGNGGAGVGIDSGDDNVIGGAGDDANTIAFNQGDGIRLFESNPGLPALRNEIGANRIFSNDQLGIDLEPDGATPNDAPPDADTGHNELQNFPLLHAATPGTGTTVAGTLLSAPGRMYVIGLFAAVTCDPSGHGEGDMPIGTKLVMTDGVGFVSFSETVATTVPTTNFVTATATDPDGNTSEFSPCRQSGTQGEPQTRPPDPPVDQQPPGGTPSDLPPPPPPPPGPDPVPDCVDRRPPITTLRRPGLHGTGGNNVGAAGARATLRLKGTSRDRPACRSGVRKVDVSLARVSGRTGVNCRFIRRPNRYVLTPRKNCRRPTLFRARGTRRWSFTFPVRLAPGEYRAQARATDRAGNKETPRAGRNIVFFRVR